MSQLLEKVSFGREIMRTFPEAIRREWVVTNGIGGYAGSSVIGANTRKHHGLLIAAFHAPTDRKVLLGSIDERLLLSNEEIVFSSAQHAGGVYTEGFHYQTGFGFDALPVFEYCIQGIRIQKKLAMEHGKNTTAIEYRIDNPLSEDSELLLRPVFHYRDHNDGAAADQLKFKTLSTDRELLLVPDEAPERMIRLYFSQGCATAALEEEKYDLNEELQTEIDTGMKGEDNGFVPYEIRIGIPAGKETVLSLVCTAEEEYEPDASLTIEKAGKRAEKLIKNAGYEDPFINRLVVSADNFIAERSSTGEKTILAGLPWFTDWGRDTMISLTGLTLITHRYKDAESILKTFTQYEKNGILPNMFPDRNVEPLYNTVDASLWFFHCVYEYMQSVEYDRAMPFIREHIYDCLKRILKAYEEGTDYSIRMEEDGLIRAGSGQDQLTWMDVRFDGRAVTPRHGKPVEINALWYNALKVMQLLAGELGEAAYAAQLGLKAEKTAESFRKRFFNPETGCLYDVVDEEDETGVRADDPKIRPNQIWAVALPFTMLSKEEEGKITETVLRKLYTDFGLRTLAPEEKEYRGIYRGTLKERDLAYHQGTAWPFLLGGFFTAILKKGDYSREAAREAEKYMKPLKQHLNDGCIGGIAEVFDGDRPHYAGGCYSQAWSVAEILRSAVLIEKYKKK